MRSAVTTDEPPREFVLVDGRTVRRTGYCCRCGECCHTGDPFSGADEGPCALFRWVGPTLGACADRHNAYYLSGCVDWPSKPEHLIGKPSCTYQFEVLSWPPRS